MATYTEVLKQLNDSYSIHEMQEMVEGVLSNNDYSYRENGSSEYIVRGEKNEIRDLIIKELSVPKAVIETVFSFTQVHDQVYIRVVLKK